MNRRRSAAFGLVLAASALVGVAAPAVAQRPGRAPAPEKGHAAAKNKMGVRIITFDPSLTRAQMLAQVAASGGKVVTDLSAIHRMAVIPAKVTPAIFDKRIDAADGVTATELDRMISLRLPDSAGGKRATALAARSSATRTDPLHDLDAFAFPDPYGAENAPGVLQWDDDANGARKAWSRTKGDRTVRVAVLDTGAQFDHRELTTVNRAMSGSTVPCQFEYQGTVYDLDCEPDDYEGHGTWVASRIAGALNGFASNGIAPKVQVMSIKVLSAAAGGGLTSWIAAGMIQACDRKADIINMSLGGYDAIGADDTDLLLWMAAINYCRSKGTAIFASAGNDHVRVNTETVTIAGVAFPGVGVVDRGNEGISSVIPGDPLSAHDLRGLVETPAGLPGVIMVSSSNNANGAPDGYALPDGYDHPTVGLRDQLAYYSSYGSRVDIGAPGGARKLGIPRYDGGNDDVLYGGWGELGALSAGGDICTASGSPLSFACFQLGGQTFGWLQGTSMSSPNAAGVAALVLAAHHNLQGHPDALKRRLQRTARAPRSPNQVGPNDPTNTAPSLLSGPCTTGFCHLRYGPGLISNRDAFGAGIVNAAAAVR